LLIGFTQAKSNAEGKIIDSELTTPNERAFENQSQIARNSACGLTNRFALRVLPSIVFLVTALLDPIVAAH
jgi:hypothetical protein